MTTVAVHRPVLEWAWRRSGRDEEAMRSKFRAWDRWLAGDEHPTFRQAQELADFTHVAFGLLLLPTPPREDLPIPDFRVGRGADAHPSRDLLETIYLNQRRQAWYEDYLRVYGADPLDFVGSARNMSPDEAAAAISTALGYGVETRGQIKSTDDARRYLTEAFESLGGLAVMSSMVANNVHRMLDLDEFRGFTLQSRMAPLVFVNGRDTKRGQVFSLLHEFAHVWRGESGVSEGGEPFAEDNSAVERWCDSVAGRVAVPAEDLRGRFRPSDSITAELDRLSGFYRCSSLVVLIRLRDTDLVARDRFGQLYEEELGRLLKFVNEQSQSRSGGDFYNNQPYRVGRALSRALIRDARQGRTPMTEALSLLAFSSAPMFDKYARRLGEAA